MEGSSCDGNWCETCPERGVCVRYSSIGNEGLFKAISYGKKFPMEPTPPIYLSIYLYINKLYNYIRNEKGYNEAISE